MRNVKKYMENHMDKYVRKCMKKSISGVTLVVISISVALNSFSETTNPSNLISTTTNSSNLANPTNSASLFSFEKQANSLYNIGLYKGIGKNKFVPDLGSTLNRQSAIIMVLRILGLENEALNFSKDETEEMLQKFEDRNDIDDWAKKQVAFANYKKIVIGFPLSQNKFSCKPKEDVTDIQYCAMLLKALGYEGFNYLTSANSLFEAGGLDEQTAKIYNASKVLNKDNLVNISYQGIQAKYASKEGKTVLENLIDTGFVSLEKIAKEGIQMTSTILPAIIPRPLCYISRTGNFTLTANSDIYVKGNSTSQTQELSKIGEYLAGKIRPSTGFKVNVIKADILPPEGCILLTTKEGEEPLGNEGYTMEVSSKAVVLKAFKPGGIFRGIQSIRQLLPTEIEKDTMVTDVQWKMPSAYIYDKPTYPWRGHMLDVSRHFFGVNDVKRSIDNMAQYKMNKFHMHLTDDQGWRIQIKAWPDLALIGGRTQVDGGTGGYYTQEEFIDIIKYANERYIELIPEIEMPSHCNAALASYGMLNPDGIKKELYTGTKVGFSSFMCQSESTYSFINDVIREIATISPSEYIHVGGDEAMSTTQEDYDYFMGRVDDIVASNGKKMIAWNGMDAPTVTRTDSLMQYWGTSIEGALSKGIKIISSTPERAYLDMKYDNSSPIGLTWAGVTPTDDAYTWDPRDLSPQAQIIGVEAPLWTETVVTRQNIDYLTYPRLLCIAEVGWTPKELRSWDEYKNRIKQHGPRMKNQKIAFYKDPVVDWD